MLAVPALGAIAVYLPALSGGFLSDDYSLLQMFYGVDAHEVAARVRKTFVSGVGPPSNQYRPLVMASFAANALLNGADAAAWRAVNVALHAANAALVALLSWQLAGPTTRGARTAALTAGLAFAWFPPSAEAVAWIAARFDGMALLWMLVAACAFMASRQWRDRYALTSLAATMLAFMSKESAAIGPALIAALAWARRPAQESFARGIAHALAGALPWLAIGAAYFAYRTWIFGDPFRFYPGTSPGSALLSGKWLAVLPASADWWPRVMPEPGLLRAYALAGLFIGIATVSAGLRDGREGRVLVAVLAAFVAAMALLFSHWGWSETGEGGRVLYALAAIAALAVALPLRSSEGGLRAAAWVVALVLLGSGLMLTRGTVERRAQAGAEVSALITALAKTADAIPAGSYAFVIVPDRFGSIPFARNAQGGLMSPPGQPRSLSPRLIVQLAEDLPGWPRMLEKNIIGRLKSEPLEDVTANPQAPGTQSLAVPDRYFCWSLKSHKLEAMPLQFEADFRDWNDVWSRGLEAAGCAG
ncbi:MAG: hypothetical protein ABWZ29_08135 [Casimicrobiaceae bacterium]